MALSHREANKKHKNEEKLEAGRKKQNPSVTGHDTQTEETLAARPEPISTKPNKILKAIDVTQKPFK